MEACWAASHALAELLQCRWECQERPCLLHVGIGQRSQNVKYPPQMTPSQDKGRDLAWLNSSPWEGFCRGVV